MTPRHHARTFQPGKYYQQETNNFNKTVAYNHHLWHEHRHWSICMPGIHSDLRSMPPCRRAVVPPCRHAIIFQVRTISPPSWGSAPRWLQAVYRVPTFNSTEEIETEISTLVKIATEKPLYKQSASDSQLHTPKCTQSHITHKRQIYKQTATAPSDITTDTWRLKEIQTHRQSVTDKS